MLALTKWGAINANFLGVTAFFPCFLEGANPHYPLMPIFLYVVLLEHLQYNYCPSSTLISKDTYNVQ